MTGGTFTGMTLVPQQDGTADIIFFQGATLEYDLTITTPTTATVFNLTGYSAKLVGRKGYGGDVVISLTSTDSSITFPSATAGRMRLNKTAASMATLTAPINGVYEMEIRTTAGVVKKPMRGNFKVIPEIVT
jgi:hypothetical protein